MKPEVESLRRINTHKSSGPDGVGNWVLKHLAKPLSGPTQNCLTNRFKLEDSLLNGNKQMYTQCLKKKTDLIKQITSQSHCLAAPKKI